MMEMMTPKEPKKIWKNQNQAQAKKNFRKGIC